MSQILKKDGKVLAELNTFMATFENKEKDLAKAKEYFNLVKELDPANKPANDFFKSPAGK